MSHLRLQIFRARGFQEQSVVVNSNIGACFMAETNNETKADENAREGLRGLISSLRHSGEGINIAEREQKETPQLSPRADGGPAAAAVVGQFNPFMQMLLMGINVGATGQRNQVSVNVQIETLNASRDTGVPLRKKLDYRDVLTESVGQCCGFNDLSYGLVWWWRYSTLVVLTLVITTFWAFRGSETTISGLAVAAASSLASMLYVITQSGVATTFLTSKSSSAVRTPSGGHQERLFAESERGRSLALRVARCFYGPIMMIFSLLDALLVGAIGQEVDGWVCNSGWISLGGVVGVGSIVRKQRYRDYGSGVKPQGVLMFDKRRVPAVGRRTASRSIIAYFSGLSEFWEYLGCQRCWIVFGHHRALRCFDGTRYTTFTMHNRNSRTLFMKPVEDLPGIMVEVLRGDLSPLDLEVFVAPSNMHFRANENYTMNLAVRSRIVFRYVLTDVSAVRVETVPGSANCHVLDGLGSSGANLDEVQWERLLRYSSDEWVSEWVIGYTAGQASEVDIYTKGDFVRTVTLAGASFPVAALTGEMTSSAVNLRRDYAQVVALEKSGTYVKARPVDCRDPFQDGRCYKDRVPEGAGLLLQIPGADPGLWTKNLDTGEIVKTNDFILPVLG